ncbi:MAG TPA: enoyl-CoA hydratase-related protein [Bacteroidales bacterium]|nr:enoyl-CoA hydratase-related protein [Bacteroidales bacterium]
MNTFANIQLEITNQTAFLRLDRPRVRNAFNEEMIGELKQAFHKVDQDHNIRALVIRGNGPVFSAGADLQWMKQTVDNTYEQNLQESGLLQDLFDTLYHLQVPTITIVHGACIGGANGLAAASDMVLAEKQTQFRFSEVRLGLVPATIAPFVVRRMGEYTAKYYMLTGRVFRGEEAFRTGLVDATGSEESLDTELDILLKELQQNSPEAMRHTKQLINNITRPANEDRIKKQTIEAIARARNSREGQEGMKAFLEKRKPHWYKEP